MSDVSILARLVAEYQDRLVSEIDDRRNTQGERTGLRMASVLFRSELKRLGIPNP